MLDITQIVLLFFSIISLTECYQSGSTYKYGYETRIEIFTAKNRTKKTNFYIAQAEFELEHNYENVYSVKFLNLHEADQLFGSETKIKILEKLLSFEYDNQNGKTGNVYFDKEDKSETKGSLLFKTSVIDLFNFNFENDVRIKSKF
jgi:hypothetical protein